GLVPGGRARRVSDLRAVLVPALVGRRREAQGGGGRSRNVGEGPSAVDAHLPLHGRGRGPARRGREGRGLAGIHRQVRGIRGHRWGDIDREGGRVGSGRSRRVREHRVVLIPVLAGRRREAQRGRGRAGENVEVHGA